MPEPRDVDYRLVLGSLAAVVLLTALCSLVCWGLHPPEHFGFQAPPRPVPTATPVEPDRFRWADRTRQTVYLPFEAACQLYLGKESHAHSTDDLPAGPAAPR